MQIIPEVHIVRIDRDDAMDHEGYCTFEQVGTAFTSCPELRPQASSREENNILLWNSAEKSAMGSAADSECRK